jgi:predicted ATPase/transcriptional regulator with XRE-family HTH domain
MSWSDDQRLEFGDLLREARRTAGLTQEELAERAGLSARGISDLERGERRAPHRDTLQLLATALNLSAAERTAWERARRRQTTRAAPASTPRAAAAPVPGLPNPLTALVGREREVREIAALLAAPEGRLVTLTGPGGIGKTRVSIAVAHAVAAAFPDGVSFVDLSAVRDPALVVPALVATLQARAIADPEPLATLRALLANRRVLLVLDNCEQVVEAAGQLGVLLAACPQLRLLTTSRTPLRLSGEREYALPPLAIPAIAEEAELDAWQIRQSEAVELFVQSARAARSSFDLTAENAADVAAICRRLDGLPLALELAAARVKVLAPGDILARLAEPLDLLTGGARDLPARQRTLRDTIRWSYEPLDQEVQAFLLAVSAFVGGWTLTAGAEVGLGAGDRPAAALERLTALIDQSLLSAHDAGAGSIRYSILETVREFGLEQLDACGERGAVFDRHARYIVALAEALEPGLRDERQRAGFRQLNAEQGNIRAVLTRSLIDGEIDREHGRRLAVALIWFWFTHNHFREARAWLELIVAAPDGAGDALWARASVGLGMMRWRLGEAQAALPLVQAGVDALRHSAEGWETMFALHQLAHIMDATGNPADGIRLFQESVDGYQELADEWGVALGCSCLGRTLAMSGQADAAEVPLARAFAMFQALGDDWYTSTTAQRLADVQLARGRRREGAAWYGQSLELFAALGDELGMADVLVSLGEIGAALGQPDPATQLLGAAQRIHGAYGMPLMASLRPAYDAALVSLRAALGAEQFEERWEQGRRLSVDAAVAAALELVAAIGVTPSALLPTPSRLIPRA